MNDEWKDCPILAIVDEREKQAGIHLHSYERAVEAERLQLEITRQQMDHRLEGMNQFQKRMDKLEGTFATKDQLAQVAKLVYIGVGIVVAIQIISKFVKF